ncbi:hypothetical protein JCM9140_3627 [Halalkalibacter wakoensis JCM 9140]|uniref:BREX-3 system P-loop-containing protein BrxF n=1 Tax=Halalkalibacter wakoensis JCM 9140 TaxID=1236970 RepID=W4Q7Z6_9BACI|nr:BREX-3 system P-loop-containing protein BrxF [Halalkalibacter wakoensis]GAE27479.1 hypothetical protein JCM9140_3627 [Halalkalibacter wakoensis JCM 9140]
MSDLTILQSEIDALESRWYKLIFYAVKRTDNVEYLSKKFDIPYVNVNLVLSEKLKDLSKAKYPLYVEDILSDYFQQVNSEWFWLGNIEILFDKQLHINPVRLLENQSKRYKLIVSWPGVLEENKLIYAEPGHPEYFVCNEFEGRIVKS